MDDPPDVATLVGGLSADSESARKYAVFRLQQSLADPSFADAFIQGDGLWPLRHAVLQSSGNTQAYAFGSLSALLELDMGWDAVDDLVIEKGVQVAVTQPLVNIVRNALTLLVLVVSRPMSDPREGQQQGRQQRFGFRALKPALDLYPGFLDALVQRLSASDHTLCANALQCINALMRDAVLNGGESEWPKFVKRLQDLGVIGGVGLLMRGESASDVGTLLSQAILEFQGLTKVLLKKWREVPVNIELAEHKRALKTIHLLSKPEPYTPEPNGALEGKRSGRKHHPEKWRRLGFETESPAWEFDETGYLGVMDLVDFVRRNEDTYVKVLMEQSMQDKTIRCPIARASVSVTLILLEHFEIDDAESEDQEEYRTYDRMSQAQIDRLYKPLLLQWGRLHTAAMNAFTRLWKAAGAETDDFYKVEEVVRIVVERIVGGANRRTDIARIEEELRNVSLQQARNWQMEGLDEIYDEAWGPHLAQVREQLHHESLQFMKEQRIRCLLQGSWSPVNATAKTWRFVRLSANKRWLHYQTYDSRRDEDPAIEDLKEKIDVNSITAVDSDVSTPAVPQGEVNGSRNDSTETLRDLSAQDSKMCAPMTRITIVGTPARTKLSTLPTTLASDPTDEGVLLELFPTTSHLASEWLDGLLMLLNQRPITTDTNRLVEMMEDWGVRLRMLNLRWEDVDWVALESSDKGERITERPVPSREGLEGEEYWYAMPET